MGPGRDERREEEEGERESRLAAIRAEGLKSRTRTKSSRQQLGKQRQGKASKEATGRLISNLTCAERVLGISDNSSSSHINSISTLSSIGLNSLLLSPSLFPIPHSHVESTPSQLHSSNSWQNNVFSGIYQRSRNVLPKRFNVLISLFDITANYPPSQSIHHHHVPPLHARLTVQCIPQPTVSTTTFLLPYKRPSKAQNING